MLVAQIPIALARLDPGGDQRPAGPPRPLAQLGVGPARRDARCPRRRRRRSPRGRASARPPRRAGRRPSARASPAARPGSGTQWEMPALAERHRAQSSRSSWNGRLARVGDFGRQPHPAARAAEVAPDDLVVDELRRVRVGRVERGGRPLAASPSAPSGCRRAGRGRWRSGGSAKRPSSRSIR